MMSLEKPVVALKRLHAIQKFCSEVTSSGEGQINTVGHGWNKT